MDARRYANRRGLTLYGPLDPARRLPHIACLGVAGIEPQAVLLGLDRAGVAAHSGSACSSESLEPSPVLEAMGVDAHHSLRVSVGWPSTDADVDHQQQEIVRALVVMAHALGIEVVAEGIESPGEARLLEQLGCHLGQGYLLARPMPVDQFTTWLTTAPTTLRDALPA